MLCYNPSSSTRDTPLNPKSQNFAWLTRDLADQEQRFAAALALLRDVILHAFPAASVAVTAQGKLVALQSFGHFTPEPESPTVEPGTLFDLASVTKVVATTTMAMLLYERGLLDLDMPLAGMVPEFAGNDPRRKQVTLRLLLAHSSGLPAYEKLFLKAQTREQLLESAFTMPLATDPGTHAAYSDIGFILLGVALERLADDTLSAFCQREILGPLSMANTGFNPLPQQRAAIPPTVNDQNFRHRVIQGEVHDENASVLGGVAGHAGLFAPAEDVARFAHMMLAGGYPILRPATISLFTRREARPANTSRTLGWDTPSSPSQSGTQFSPGSFGHLGYTGTSLWIDPERQVSITLLTNRTWPDCANHAIQQLRPRFHDAIMEALTS